MWVTCQGQAPCKLGKFLWRGPNVPLISLTSPSAQHLDVHVWDQCLSSSCGCSYPKAVGAALLGVYLEDVLDGIYFLAEQCSGEVCVIIGNKQWTGSFLLAMA